MNDDILHPGRHSIRLKGADYSRPALYSVTICSSGRRCIFGEVREAHIYLTPLGRLVQANWREIPNHFASVGILEHIVMPTHVHGIVEIHSQLGRSNAPPLRRETARGQPRPASLPAIIRSFKSAVSNTAHSELEMAGEIWQRSYFERILRPGRELASAQTYILDNPKKWECDRNNPDHSQV